jgi:hypothetical protein
MQRRSVSIVLSMILASTAAFAIQGQELKLTGFVIDNMCAEANASTLSEKAKGHPTACATMPNCAKSGYSVISEGKRYKLDEDGNKKMMALFKGSKTKKGMSVTVEGTVEGDVIRVKKISEAESTTN